MIHTIEAVAHYQRVGDGPGIDWAGIVLSEAAVRGEIDHSWTVFGEWQQSWVQVLVFTYRFEMVGDEDGVPATDVAEQSLDRAERIVGESDVQVLGFKVVP